MSDTLTVHHLEYSRSHRILWLLEELGLPYEIKHYRRTRAFLAPKELKAVHPLGKSPVVTWGDKTLAESGAILQYLAETHPNTDLTVPVFDPAYADYLYWLHAAEGSMMPWLVMKLVFQRVPKAPMPFFVRPVARNLCGRVIKSLVQPNIDTHLAAIEDWLRDRTWFAGDRMTLADIQMSYPLEAASSRTDLGDYPAVNAYLERIRTLPAYRAALEKGGSPTP